MEVCKQLPVVLLQTYC